MELDGRSKTDAPLTGVWSASNLEIMMSVGQQLGVSVEVKARAGENYPIKSNTGFATVRPDGVYLEIKKNNNSSLQEFWQRVDKAKAKPVNG